MAKDTDLARKRAQMDAAAMRTYLGIARAWELKEHDAARLLSVADSTCRRRKSNPERTSPDASQREPMSLLLGIHKSLHILRPRPELADGWLHRENSNPTFAGHKPIDRCVAVLRPPALSPARQDAHLIHEWDGARIAHVFELSLRS